MKPKKRKNKTAFCAFLLAALLPLSLKAQSANLDLSYTAAPLGIASQVASAMYGLDSSLTYTATLRQIAVDAFGNIKTTGSGLTYTSATTVNANGLNFLSFTAVTGVTTNAATTLSLTWAASTTSGPVFGDINCSGATGVYYAINASATPIAGMVANAALMGYQPCGQISQIPLEWNAANTPHAHFVATGLSGTSAAVGITTKQRP